MRALVFTLVGLSLAPPTGRGHAQSNSVPRFEAARDEAARRAADSLQLSPQQREAFYTHVDTAVADARLARAAGGRMAIDSALALVVRETGRKMHFVRQARVIFSDMYARRAGDRDRAPGTEEELWRSPANVAGLIELYRQNPDASDWEMERAMAVAFRKP
ncbi:MAG TPA: hypothetical protein VFU46_14910 [Gemmatimonadales bacterium]|nr:hypothetical protein [Gemmatimonadales bacterium]